MRFVKKRPQRSELDDSESSYSDGETLLEVEKHESESNVASRKEKTRQRRRLLVIGVIVMSVIIIIAVVAFVVHMTTESSADKYKISNEAVITPYVDNRTYRAMKLANGLGVLLISDAGADYAAASMDVHVGSMSDPPDVQGLAHFCEHMLFLGTEKYKDESAYSGFLSEHGGYDNAFTSQDHTNYFFKIEQQSFVHALDMFAQFFIAPLFTASSAEREMHAVDSEHQKNLQNDDWRIWQITKDLSNQKSAFHGFSTGNIETLNVANIHGRLLKFHGQHYSSNQMQLVVLGRENIETLTKVVSNLFSPIENKHVTVSLSSADAYPPGYTGKQIWIPAVEDNHRLLLRWPVQSLLHKYRANPSGFLSYLLGDEGPGSVIALLRDKGWATALSTGSYVDVDMFSMFEIEMTLTDEGLPHIDCIIDVVFDYIYLIQTTGIVKEQWQDTIDVRTVNFRFRPKEDPASYVRDLASFLRYAESPADFLEPPSRAVWDHDLLLSVVNTLTPDNMLVFILSRPSGILEWPELDMVEKWYKVRYHVANISRDRLDKWRDTSSINASLSLPPANNYIPRDLSLLPLPKINALYPTAILKQQGMEVWWKQDVVFRTPKVHLFCDFSTPITYNSSSNAVLSQLYRHLVVDSLYKPLYAAVLAGYKASFGLTTSGFTMKFYGYSDKETMMLFINTAVQHARKIATATPEYLRENSRYRVALEDTKQAMENYPFSQQPYLTAYDFTDVALEETYWTSSEQLEALKHLNETDFLHFASHLMDAVSVKCFVHGNVDKQLALKYANSVVDGLHSTLGAPSPVPRRMCLKAGDNFVYRMRGLDHNDTNSAIRGLYQIGRACFPERRIDKENCSKSLLERSVRMSLVNLIIENACFEQLRTQEQLGYIVACRTHTNEDVLSFQVIIQSAIYNASYLTERAEAFLILFSDTLKSTVNNADSFDNLKRSLLDELRSKDLSLEDASDRYWGEIVTNENQFSWVSQLISTVKDITADSVIRFYDMYINGRSSQRRRFVVELYGKGRSIAEGGDEDSKMVVLKEGDLKSFKENAVFCTHP